MGGGERFDVGSRTTYKSRLGTYANATQQDAQDAIDAALAAAPRGARCPSTTARRSSCAPPSCCPAVARDHRRLHHAPASPGGQQAEIDSPCELIDFWRFNVHYARNILAGQPPANSQGVEPHGPPPAGGLRLRDHAVQLQRDRAANLPTAPALMGNVASGSRPRPQTHAAVLLMQLLEEAGCAKGVINLAAATASRSPRSPGAP